MNYQFQLNQDHSQWQEQYEIDQVRFQNMFMAAQNYCQAREVIAAVQKNLKTPPKTP